MIPLHTMMMNYDVLLLRKTPTTPVHQMFPTLGEETEMKWIIKTIESITLLPSDVRPSDETTCIAEIDSSSVGLY